MNRQPIALVIALLADFMQFAPYRISNMSGTVVEMDSRFDNNRQKDGGFGAEIQNELDREMSEVIGTSSQLLDYGRPKAAHQPHFDVMKLYGDEQVSVV
jgi:hypothetical protein